MDEKISHSAVEQYSEKFAAAISDSFFASNKTIGGAEILSLKGVRQVNLFVICELMHTWKAEISKLKSPYFDYSSPAVIDALKEFQNVLSNHISIDHHNFMPLLKKAVERTLYVILSPYDFYSDSLERMGSGAIDIEVLKGDLKYLKINRAPMEKLVQKLDEKKLISVQRNEAFALLDTILEEVNFTPEEIESHLPEFSKIIPIRIDDFYAASATANEKGDINEIEPIAVKKSEPVYSTPIVVSQKPTHAINKPIERNGKQVSDLNKIARIKDSLTINQKFMFTKILFHGDFEIFSQAIDRLDMLDNLSQANNYIDTNWPEWDKDSVEYEEFMEMLTRRFI